MPSDWFNKQLNGQQLDRKRLGGTSENRQNSVKKKGSHQPDAEEAGLEGGGITSTSNVVGARLIEMC